MLASTPRRARRHLSAGVVAVLACTLAACDDGDTVSRTAPDVTDTTAPDVTDPAAGDEKVVVAFDGLTGAEGRTIVGVFNPERSTALGGFRLDVDSDPFSARQIVFARDPDKGTMPPVSDVAVLVSPGTYPLILFLIDRDGNDYGYTPWAPAAQPGLSFCRTRVEVRADVGGEVTITGAIPPGRAGGDMDDCTISDQ